MHLLRPLPSFAVVGAFVILFLPSPSSAQDPIDTPTADPQLGIESKVSVRFFGDVNVVRDPGGTTSFSLGQLDLFATARLSERWQFLAETVAEASPDNEVAIEVERALIQFLAPGGVRVAAGRYHTAIGYYNNAYHHGLWFQTSASRPRMFAFEDQGGLLPVHQVGLTADGPIPLMGTGLRWTAEIGNGHAAPGAEPVQVGRDEDRSKSVNLALISRPARFPGAQAGISFYADRFHTSPTANMDEFIVAAHVVYTQAPYEWLSEYARVRHTPDSGGDTVTRTWYVQAARQVGAATPFVRYESIDADPTDVLVGVAGRLRGPSVGLRVDVTPSAALKVQYDQRHQDGRSDRSVIAQVAFVL
jgi:hypothetical protein